MTTDIGIENENTSSSPNYKGWIRIALGLIVVGAIVAVVLGPTEEWLRTTADLIRGMGVGGAVVFVAAYIVATVLFIPGSLLTIAAGFLFGLLWGSIIVSVVSTAGLVGAAGAASLGARSAIIEKELMGG